MREDDVSDVLEGRVTPLPMPEEDAVKIINGDSSL